MNSFERRVFQRLHKQAENPLGLIVREGIEEIPNIINQQNNQKKQQKPVLPPLPGSTPMDIPKVAAEPFGQSLGDFFKKKEESTEKPKEPKAHKETHEAKHTNLGAEPKKKTIPSVLDKNKTEKPKMSNPNIDRIKNFGNKAKDSVVKRLGEAASHVKANKGAYALAGAAGLGAAFTKYQNDKYKKIK